MPNNKLYGLLGHSKRKMLKCENAIKPTFPHPVTTLQFYQLWNSATNAPKALQKLKPIHENGKLQEKNDFNQTVLPFSGVFDAEKK